MVELSLFQYKGMIIHPEVQLDMTIPTCSNLYYHGIYGQLIENWGVTSKLIIFSIWKVHFGV